MYGIPTLKSFTRIYTTTQIIIRITNFSRSLKKPEKMLRFIVVRYAEYDSLAAKQKNYMTIWMVWR